MEHLFNQLSDTLFSKLDNEEQLIINFQGEDTIFVRFNKSKVRQASDVKQLALSLTLKSDHKETEMTMFSDLGPMHIQNH